MRRPGCRRHSSENRTIAPPDHDGKQEISGRASTARLPIPILGIKSAFDYPEDSPIAAQGDAEDMMRSAQYEVSNEIDRSHNPSHSRSSRLTSEQDFVDVLTRRWRDDQQ
jgi:hypothetical protein